MGRFAKIVYFVPRMISVLHTLLRCYWSSERVAGHNRSYCTLVLLGQHNTDLLEQSQGSSCSCSGLRWEFIKENKKVRNKKTRTRPRKRPRKKEKNFHFFLVEFLFFYFLVFFYKCPPLYECVIQACDRQP